MDRDNNPVRRARLYRLNIIILSIITMLSALGALYLRNQLRRAWDPGEQQSSYGSQRIRELKEEGAAQGREETLAEIRRSLEEGTTTSGLVRELFASDIVISSGGRYWFTPIDPELVSVTADRTELEIGEDGTVRYTGKDPGTRVIRGIDVSEENGVIDWERTAGDQLGFAMVHLGHGNNDGSVTQDRRFARNAAGALQYGLRVGCYMEVTGDDRDTILSQARFLVETLEPYGSRFSYPAALLLHFPEGTEEEDPEIRTHRSKALEEACALIEEAGYTPAIGGDIAALTLFIDPQILKDRDKWYTGFDDSLYYPYAWSIWQYHAGSHIEGVTGDVNLDLHLLKE